MCPLPIAADNLLDRSQSLAAFRPYGKFQDEPLCVWTTGHLKPNGSEQHAALAECQLSVSGQFMHVETRTLHVSQLAPRIMPALPSAGCVPINS
jgi:hypothetical protein